MTPPDKALAELDRWHALGLTVHLTEFDLETTDEELQADYTRDLLTVAFSHPGVSSVMTWGFWEGRHWRPDAALWRKDWSLKPNGNVWTDLTRGAWWTKAAGATDGEGRWTARGFLGDYTATVRAGDRATTTRVSAREPSRTVRVTLP